MKDGYSVVADISTEYLVTDSTQQYFLELYKDDFQVSWQNKQASDSVTLFSARDLYKCDTNEFSYFSGRRLQ